MTSEGVWMYTVVGDGPIDDELPPGVAGERVRTVEAAGLTAVVGSVGLDVFGDEPLRRNLEDLEWLENVARAHDSVVGAVSHTADTVPLRLATVCPDDDRVRSVLAERRADFDAALRRIAGRAEWGVRGVADLSVPPEPDPGGEDETVGAGARYLARRRAELSSREEIERGVAAEADDIHTTLLDVAVAGRRQRSTAPELAGTRAWTPLNGTYLIERRRTGDFAATVSLLNRTHPRLELELTGPWPPYSFTGIDEDPGPS